MKILAFILGVLVTNFASSQNKAGRELYFEITCGVAAQTSKEVQAFKEFARNNDTSLLRDKLFYGSKLEKVLSAIIILYLQKSGSIKLSHNEQNQIQKIAKLRDRFSLCYTCTFRQQGTIRELFHRKKYLGSYFIIETFLEGKL